MDVSYFPTINATFNGVASIFLMAGYFMVKRRRNTDLHAVMMILALISSALFLACYVYYHYHAGSTRYQGEGVLRYIYFFILMTHVPLATLMVPFIAAAVWFAYRKRFDWHVRLVKWVWPVWMYVSVTGVLIYVMLYHL